MSEPLKLYPYQQAMLDRMTNQPGVKLYIDKHRWSTMDTMRLMCQHVVHKPRSVGYTCKIQNCDGHCYCWCKGRR